MIYILDFRGSNVGGPVLPGRLIKGNEDSLRQEEKVTFLLHGFNVNRTEGKQKLLALADHLSELSGAIVCVLWPGDHWMGPLSYSFEGRDADDTALELANYIERVIVPGIPLSFIAHSLGSRVVMETVTSLIGLNYPVQQICLMAAAIDDYSLACLDKYQSAVKYSGRVAVLSSKKDKVLKYAYPVGDLLQAFLFFRREQFGLALGYEGPKRCPITKNPVAANVIHESIPEQRNAGHGDYLPSNPPNQKQISAVHFAKQVVMGETNPKVK